MFRNLIYTEMSSTHKAVLTIIILLVMTGITHAQGDRKLIREGNREYEKSKFSEAEISYRKAIDKNKSSADAIFNVGDALYKQRKFEDAQKQFVDNHSIVEDKEKKSASLYNLGNSLLMANKVQESIDAYKGSLRFNPSNMEAKYNLAYAQDLLRKQQQQQQQQSQSKQDQNKDNRNRDQNKQQENNKQEQEKNQQQKKQDQQEISPEDARRLLNAIANDEKNVQEKVKLAKAIKAKVRTIKNW